MTRALAHRRYVLGAHLVRHAYFTGSLWVVSLPVVLQTQVADLIVPTFFALGNDRAADLDVAVWVRGVADGEGDGWATVEDSVLDPPARGVEDDRLAVKIEP